MIALAVLGVLLLLAAAALAAVSLVRMAGDISLTEGSTDSEQDGGDDPATAPEGDVEVEVPDTSDLDGVDAELAEVLIGVDRAEREMMAAQEGFAEVLAAPGDDGEAAALEELSTVAGDAQRELQELRRELTAPVESSEVRAIRDRYLSHLDAWVRYLVAVEQDPTVLAGGPDAEAYLLAIDTSGEAFAREVRDGLPDGLDDRVREFALQIVARGFPERQPPSGGTV